jgi:hypothetical protein
MFMFITVDMGCHQQTGKAFIYFRNWQTEI